MKILAVSNLYPPHHIGGYELQCQRMCEGLRGLGHEVFVLTSDHGVSEGAASEAGVRRALRIHGMFGHPWLPLMRLQELERHNNRVLRETIREFRPDVVHGWNFSGLSKSMLWTLQREGRPTAFCVCDHWIARAAEADVWLKWWNQAGSSPAQRLFRKGLEALGYRRRWEAEAPMEPVGKMAFRRAYFCSAALRELTARAGFAVEEAAIIRCSVDTRRFAGSPRSTEAPLQRLLWVGRLHPDKGPMTALRAMTRLRDKYAGKLSLYGRGEPDYENELKKFVRENDLPVTFHEGTPEEMPRVYAGHDALLFTSEWLEPFAITPLEAMASGLPVISTLTGGSAELFRHGENALTYEAGDADDLARQIVALDRDREMRRRIATQGQQDVREACADERVARQTEAYLEETIRIWKP